MSFISLLLVAMNFLLGVLILNLLFLNMLKSLVSLLIVLLLFIIIIPIVKLLKKNISMIDDLTRITCFRAQVAGMIHDLMLFSPERPGMRLKDIASYIGVSSVSCSRAHTGTTSLSYLPFTKLQELYFQEFGHEYGK